MPGQLDEAVRHYQGLFGLEEKSRGKDGVELRGSNFTIWIDEDGARPPVRQEFVAQDAAEARRAVESSGGTVTGDTHSGFHVLDPYGLCYHVFIDDEPES